MVDNIGRWGELKLSTLVIYHRILALENVDTAVNYYGIFITSAPWCQSYKTFYNCNLALFIIG
jgi:hypothetical protein